MTERFHTMQPGDSLWSIAQQATSRTEIDAATYWVELIRLNRAAISATRPLRPTDAVLVLPDPHLP